MTATVADESVLCFPAALLDEFNLGFQGFTSVLNTLYTVFVRRELGRPQRLFSFPRSEVESDSTYKQLVTYSVVQYGFLSHGPETRVLTYLRGGSGGESRLHARRSLGLGGHVPGDCTILADVRADAMREIREEVSLDAKSPLFYMAGLINTDSDDVGRVHFGVVHRLFVDSMGCRAREGCMEDLRWMAPREMEREIESFETWSQVIIKQMLVLPGDFDT